MEEKRNACRVLMWKPKEMRPPGRFRHRSKDIIKMVLKKDRSTWTKLN
jgi:hypothetical protein